MLKQHYKVTTDVARVYKVRNVSRPGWGWAVATLREWPRGGQIDVQSDFGSFSYSWCAIGDRTLREFLCGVGFDYFMNKTRGTYQVFDEEKTRRAIKAEIFSQLAHGLIDRDTAHEWRDELDEVEESWNEVLFLERLHQTGLLHNLYDDYPSLKTRDCPQCRAFWDGPWAKLCDIWRDETKRETRVAVAAAL